MIEECRGFDCTNTLSLEIASALTIAAVLLVFLPFFATHLDRSQGLSSTQIRGLRRLLWSVPIAIALAGLDAVIGLLTLWGKIEAGQIAGWMLVALVILIVALSFTAVSIEAGVTWPRSLFGIRLPQRSSSRRS